ncbi:MAG: VOC family protein [Bacteroidota bacterium]
MRSILFLLSLVLLGGCQTEKGTSVLQVDHVNIWIDEPAAGKKKLEALGFTAIPDSLCQVHQGQGTTGRYFYFLNAYLELIFINDREEFERNAQKNNALDFLERSNSPDNGFCPFGVALKVDGYDREKIPFDVVAYSQDWMGHGNNIYTAKNSKTKKEEPSIFVVYPEIEFDVFDSKDDLLNIPNQYAMWRQFYQHDNGVEKITKIKIHSHQLEETSQTVQALRQIGTVELLEGEPYLMDLYFDDHRQNQSHDLRPVLPLRIFY